MTNTPYFATSQENGATLMNMTVDRLDAHIADDVKHAMRDVIPASHGGVIIDMEKVNFVDSSGLGTLVAIRKHIGPDRDMCLRNTAPFVTKVLHLTKLDTVFTL